MKAPLPPNWVPYQGRDGEVYYKHRITQEKTYDHPTDTEYRKKYEQQKEKMARKNLKSMGMKASGGPSGLGGGLLGSGLGLGGGMQSGLGLGGPVGLAGNNSGLMNASGVDMSTKLDPKVEE